MSTGNIGPWKKKVGDKITAGDALVEIETDKAAMDFEAAEDGFLAKILRESGSKDVPTGEVGIEDVGFRYLLPSDGLVAHSPSVLSPTKPNPYPNLPTMSLQLYPPHHRHRLPRPHQPRLALRNLLQHYQPKSTSTPPTCPT
jgi:hypothetical protein